MGMWEAEIAEQKRLLKAVTAERDGLIKTNAELLAANMALQAKLAHEGTPVPAVAASSDARLAVVERAIFDLAERFDIHPSVVDEHIAKAPRRKLNIED